MMVIAAVTALWSQHPTRWSRVRARLNILPPEATFVPTLPLIFFYVSDLAPPYVGGGAVMSPTISLKLRSRRVTMLPALASSRGQFNRLVSVRPRDHLTFSRWPSQDVDNWMAGFKRWVNQDALG